MVVLLAHYRVEVRAPEEEDLLERFPKVAVQSRVDDRVEQRVGVAQPQEGGQEEIGHHVVRVQERTHNC